MPLNKETKSCSGDLGSVKYSFIAITSLSPQILSGYTKYDSIYVSYRYVDGIHIFSSLKISNKSILKNILEI